MILLGLLELKNGMLIPVGSMVIANAMNTCSQSIERFRADVESQIETIEGYVALGASKFKAVESPMQKAIRSAMIPRIDALSSLGIIWIPGIMAGMILSGADPIQSALYQFVIMVVMFCSSALTGLSTIYLSVDAVFLSIYQQNKQDS